MATAMAATAGWPWTCFEERLLKDRPGADIGAELAISTDAVYVYASRVMKEVRRQCATVADELGDEPIDWLPRQT